MTTRKPATQLQVLEKRDAKVARKKATKRPTTLRKAISAGAEVITAMAPVLFEKVEEWYTGNEKVEYYVKIGNLWLWMALVSPPWGNWEHPNIHFVFTETSTEVGEYLLKLYPEYGDQPRIEIRKAKVHRPGVHFEI